MNPYQAPRDAENDGAQPHVAEPQAKAKFNTHTLELLRSARPWQMLVGVTTLLIAIGFFIAIPIILWSSHGSSGIDGAYRTGESIGRSVMLALFGSIYLYPALKLIASSRALARLAQSRSANDLETALNAQKSFWRYAGICMIGTVLLYSVFGLAALAAALK